MFRGFTLIEMIISMLLLMLILFSIGVLIPYSQVRMKKTANRDVAVLLAENMIENIRAMYFDNITSSTYDGIEGTPASIDVGGSQMFPPLPYPREDYGYLVEGNVHQVTYTYVVYAHAAGSPENYKEVSVSVYWSEDTNRERDNTVKELKSITVNGGIYRR